MFAYWLLFAVFAFGALLEQPYVHWQRKQLDLLFLFAMAFLAVLIGLRFQVGGDWGSYLRLFRIFSYADASRAYALGDPAYHLLSVAAHELGFGIWFVNLVCAVIFTWGLYRLALTQPSPWLTVVVAIPYLVIVVAMGYTRQAVAIGVLMAGLARFQFHGSVLRFAIYVFAAALFHRTAVVALPLVALGGRRNLAINVVIAIAVTTAIYDSLVAPEMDRLVSNYVKTELNSQGAVIRVFMSVVPAAIFLAMRDRLGFSAREAIIWRNFAFGSIAALLALPLFTSTVVDRLALYLLPLQLVVMPRLPGTVVSLRNGILLIIAYALAIQFTWLNFATNSYYWLPYRFTPFVT